MTNPSNPIDALIEHLKASQASLTKLLGVGHSIHRDLPYPQLPPGQGPYPQLPPSLVSEYNTAAPPAPAPATAAPTGAVYLSERTSNPFNQSLYRRSGAPRATTQAPASMSGQPAPTSSTTPVPTTASPTATHTRSTATEATTSSPIALSDTRTDDDTGETGKTSTGEIPLLPIGDMPELVYAGRTPVPALDDRSFISIGAGDTPGGGIPRGVISGLAFEALPGATLRGDDPT